MLIDNGAGGAWGTFKQSIDTYDAGYIPWNAVLRGSNMAYIWADSATATNPLSGWVAVARDTLLHKPNGERIEKGVACTHHEVVCITRCVQ